VSLGAFSFATPPSFTIIIFFGLFKFEFLFPRHQSNHNTIVCQSSSLSVGHECDVALVLFFVMLIDYLSSLILKTAFSKNRRLSSPLTHISHESSHHQSTRGIFSKHESHHDDHDVCEGGAWGGIRGETKVIIFVTTDVNQIRPLSGPWNATLPFISLFSNDRSRRIIALGAIDIRTAFKTTLAFDERVAVSIHEHQP
jgi:hypothetical protein